MKVEKNKVYAFMFINLAIDLLLIVAFVMVGRNILASHGLQESLQMMIPVIIVIALGYITRIMSFNGGRYNGLVGVLTYVLPMVVFPVTVALAMRGEVLTNHSTFGVVACAVMFSVIAFAAVSLTNAILSQKR